VRNPKAGTLPPRNAPRQRSSRFWPAAAAHLGVVLLLVTLAWLAWGAGFGKGVEGTYSNDAKGLVVELKPGGIATFTSSLGDTNHCAYAVNHSKLLLVCKHDKVEFAINRDGSLTAPFFGTVRKARK
jgi:hypothetical protein